MLLVNVSMTAPFEFWLGSKLVHEMGSFVKGLKNLTTQIGTQTFVEVVVVEVMQVNEVAKLF